MAEDESNRISPGVKVWVPDPAEAYVSGSVVSVSGEAVKVATEAGEAELKHADLCLVEHADREDMVTLNYLHEPGVLHNLKNRYGLDEIYTYTGNILIAVNPFQRLPHLYDRHMMDQYRGHSLGELSPHVFAIAETSFEAMRRENASQSILVSGESGAGKTETAKQIMHYLAHMGGRAGDVDERADASGAARPVEQKVLESNPLLEAFGNAKTVRNDNSSRFGKFIEIQFDNKNAISGAAIRTYLLERSRIVQVDDPERNFHVFYQLCDGADDVEKKSLRLKAPTEFSYLNASSCHTLEGVDNAAEYRATRRAMDVVGIEKDAQDAVMRVVAGVLHLGNVAFADADDDAADDGCVLAGDASRAALADAAAVLRVDAARLEKALRTRTIETRDGAIEKPLDVAAATNSRDSLAKTLYARLFDWLVAKINTSIGQDASSKRFIGVLDIYGFESFKTNSFEQFCINLANEKLQQHFNQHVFKTEQEEYEREAIDWSYIEFVDNQDVLDLIEKRPTGIISLLDEACMFPATTHEQFAQKLYGALKDQSRFKKPKRSTTAFTLDHYAGEVTYESDHFLEKNKDFVIVDHQKLLGDSEQALLREMFAAKETPSKASGNGAAGNGGARASKSAMKFSSIGAAFKLQLAELMKKLNETEPHYIRCIKPNGVNVPSAFENANVLHQLRCGGVLEAVRISCAGYPSRKPIDEFLDRFGLLARDKEKLFTPGEEFSVARSILENAGLTTWQIGKTKVFLRAGQMASLDMIRHKKMTSAATYIQKMARGVSKKREFAEMKRAALCVAKWSRGMLARRLVAALRLERAAIKTQARARTALAVRQFNRCKKAAVAIQAAARAAAARARVNAMRRERAAVRLQAFQRGRAARFAYLRARFAAVAFQCAWRAKVARARARRLRQEAKEAGALLAAKSELEKQLELERTRAELERRRLADAEAKREKEAKEAAARMAALEEEMRMQREAAEAEARLRAEEAAIEEQKRRDEEARVMREREKEAEIAANAARLAALEAAAAEAELAAEAARVAAATELDAERARSTKLEAQCDELRTMLTQAETKTESLAEKVLMLETENARLKQMAKENVMRAAAMRAGVGDAARSPPRGSDAFGVASPATPESATSTPGDQDSIRRRVEAEAKAKSLASQKTFEEHETLLATVERASEIGFSGGQPVLACVTFRSLLHWKSFELERTGLFDQIMSKMSNAVELNTDNNAQLTYWLSNTFALLHLLQRTLKTSGGAASRRRAGLGSGVGIFERFNSRLRAASAFSDTDKDEPPVGIPGVRQVDAKYPAFLFKQQLTAFVEKIYGFLRDNMKKEITPQLGSCIQAPRAARGGAAARRGASLTQTATSTADGGAHGPQLGTHWRAILDCLDALLVTFRANHVPVFLVRKFFTQIFCFINVQLFNALLLRRECCSFSNGEYIKTGLAELEVWLIESKEWTGAAWEELRYIRQAVQLLVIHQKPKKTLNEITLELCPVLSIQQLYRISTMYWDDKYGTETVSQEVLHAMKELMMKDQNTNMSNSFLLDDDSSIHFTIDDISGAPTTIDLDAVQVPPHLAKDPCFEFLLHSVSVSENGTA